MSEINYQKTILGIEILIKYLLKNAYKCITYFNNSNIYNEYEDEFFVSR